MNVQEWVLTTAKLPDGKRPLADIDGLDALLSSDQHTAMLKALLRAIVAGTIAGTAFPVIILALAIFGSSGSALDLRAAIGISVGAVLIPFCLVACSAIALGVPATLVLRKLHWEHEPAYIFVGCLLGFLVLGIIFAVAEGDVSMVIRTLPFETIGAFSGTVTARSWWRGYREEQANGG